jgi:hypothetical protein
MTWASPYPSFEQIKILRTIEWEGEKKRKERRNLVAFPSFFPSSSECPSNKLKSNQRTIMNRGRAAMNSDEEEDERMARLKSAAVEGSTILGAAGSFFFQDYHNHNYYYREN